MKSLSGSTLKLVAMITMLIDHIAAVPIGRILLSGGWSESLHTIYSIMRQVGRLSFPIFCFLLVEGFGKTASRAKYALRLGVFALLSEIPFDLAVRSKVLEFGRQNVFFTLFLGMTAMCAYDLLAKRRPPKAVQWILCAVGTVLFGGWLMRHRPSQLIFDSRQQNIFFFGLVCFVILSLLMLYGKFFGKDKLLTAGTDLAVMTVFILLADLLKTDYSGVGILTITAIYAFRGFYLPAMAAGTAVLALLGVSEMPALFAVIPAALYNGKRGLKLKYFFYIFYPAHLLVLWAVVRFMKIG